MYELNPLMETVINGYFGKNEKTTTEKGWNSFTAEEKQQIIKNLGYTDLEQKINDLQNLIKNILTTVNKDSSDISEKLKTLLNKSKIGGGYGNNKMFKEEDIIEEIHNKLNTGYTLIGGNYTNLNEINNSLKKSNSYIMDKLDLIYGGAIDVNDTIRGIDGLADLVNIYNDNIGAINSGIAQLVDNHQAEIDKLTQRLKKSMESGEFNAEELNNTIAKLQGEIDKLTAENDTLKYQLSKDAGESGALSAELAEAKGKIAELEAQITVLREELAKKQTQNTEKQEELVKAADQTTQYQELLLKLMKAVTDDTTKIRNNLPQPTATEGGNIRTSEDALLDKLRGVVSRMAQTPKAMVGGGSSNLLKQKYAEIKALHRQNKAIRQNIMVGGSYEQSLMANNQLYNNYNQIRQNSVDMMAILQGMQPNPQFNKNLNMNLQNALIRGDPVAQQVQGQLEPSSMQRLASMLGL